MLSVASARRGVFARPVSPARTIAAGAALVLGGLARASSVEPEPQAGPTASRWTAYEEQRPKSVVELQPWRSESSIPIVTRSGREGVATLVDLQPRANVWFLVRLEWVGGGDPEVYHLENPEPGGQRILLDSGWPHGLQLVRDGRRHTCDLWGDHPAGALVAARAEGRPFARLCGGRLYVRNRTEGRRSAKEITADFLRDRVWGGEKITTLVRDTLFRNSYRKTARLSGDRFSDSAGVPGAPLPPRLDPAVAERRVDPLGLGLTVGRETDGKLALGRWYAVDGAPGAFVSAVRADAVAREIVDRQDGAVRPLDSRESSALVYVVAFDLTQFDLGFALGTDHPRVGWSERTAAASRNDALPGPDGIGTVAPLVRTGMLNPAEAVRVAATFTGGFKRSHGAFRTGALSQVNHGSHYGFVEKGVILSKLQPGLSTIWVDVDGEVTIDVWTEERNAGLARILHARQNGVPLLERDPVRGGTRPGALVGQWGAGNWSGSVDKSLRTLRAGGCTQQGPGGSFLLYGYFSAATPSAMARVFEAYRCSHAMLLDMNALEHTYLAVYRVVEGRLVIEHLIDEMKVLDKVVDGQPVPRFVGVPDNRDFFFLTRKEGAVP